jgi:poly-gamma-glutamate synthesis protein (capsule biosynthesis protein)
MNLFDKELDESQYPLTFIVRANFGTAGDAQIFSELTATTNRDVSKMATVAMTGVTAMVRGTAVMMERKGITYPAQMIRDWLVTADITHISNEVSFWDKCPAPTFNDGVSMCSNPRYIELLEYVGTDIIELSGNHLWDKGTQHLNTTIDIYDELGWKYFAGGRNYDDSQRPVTMTVAGNKIAFVGCNYFGADWATPANNLPGSALCGSDSPRQLDLIISSIQSLAQEGYLVIATLQYAEFYFYEPTLQQARDFKALREAGAVIVNGSQGHHAQGFDVSEQGFLHYGTGNLFFGDQAATGTHQTFVDRHTFYDGRYLGVDIRTAYIEDYSQPVPMSAADRVKFLRVLFAATGY